MFLNTGIHSRIEVFEKNNLKFSFNFRSLPWSVNRASSKWINLLFGVISRRDARWVQFNPKPENCSLPDSGVSRISRDSESRDLKRKA